MWCLSLCSSLVCWHDCWTEIICWCRPTSTLVTPERIHLLTWLCFRLLCPNCMFIGQSELVIMAEPSAPNIWSSVPFFPKSKVATLVLPEGLNGHMGSTWGSNWSHTYCILFCILYANVTFYWLVTDTFNIFGLFQMDSDTQWYPRWLIQCLTFNIPP